MCIKCIYGKAIAVIKKCCKPGLHVVCTVPCAPFSQYFLFSWAAFPEAAASVHDHHCISIKKKRLSSFSSIQPITKKKASLRVCIYIYVPLSNEERLEREKHGCWMILLCRVLFTLRYREYMQQGERYALFLILGPQHCILSIIISL